MAKIKSAWEIALEKTENIVVNKEKFEKDDKIKQVRAIAGKFLSLDENMSEEDVKTKLNSFDNEFVKEGISLVLIQNLTLLNDIVSPLRYNNLYFLASLITNKEETLNHLNQIIGFLKQYPEHRKQLVEQMKTQFSQVAEQKAQAFEAQYGQSVPFSLENDPEFISLLKTQLEKLQNQYSQTLDEAKEQLKDFLA